MGWNLIRLYAVAVYIFMFAPVAVVLLLAFNSSQFGGFPIEGFSLQWFEKLYENEAIVRAFKTSFVLGIGTAILATTIGILASLALVRYRFPGKAWITTFLISPVLVPETVLAVGLLLFLRWLSMPRSFALLLIGHTIIALPFVVLVVQARLVGIRKDYEEAALSLGANPLQTFFQITLPLLMPAVFAGALFAFTISFDNITATIFWRPAGSETVPTQIFGMLRNSVSPEINALGFVMIVITVGVPLMAGGLARYFTRKQR
ncbi:ABC transporter permease [Nisaea denitrificans]|uniref:ABC transporter permease n=1 Tax=Nisaea denitrificans TaxID=390877 RepID=UPI00041FD6A0|nr:ABC transporter permease [Nisaea denitrificans]